MTNWLLTCWILSSIFRRRSEAASLWILLILLKPKATLLFSLSSSNNSSKSAFVKIQESEVETLNAVWSISRFFHSNKVAWPIAAAKVINDAIHAVPTKKNSRFIRKSKKLVLLIMPILIASLSLRAFQSCLNILCN